MDYIGEPVSQLEHALQAAYFASRTPASDCLILAALLHDIGHIIAPSAPQMGGLGTLNHEDIGADWLAAQGCGYQVTELVRGHVQAKRYLCYAKPTYLESLSAASRGTLEWQGGVMTDTEAESFQQSPHFKAILAMRKWDEMAKVSGLKVPTLESYNRVLSDHLYAQGEP